MEDELSAEQPPLIPHRDGPGYTADSWFYVAALSFCVGIYSRLNVVLHHPQPVLFPQLEHV
jgi:hypothetical protein